MLRSKKTQPKKIYRGIKILKQLLLSEIDQGVQFGPKTDCESEAKANFFSNRKAKAKRSEHLVPKSEAKRSDIASLSLFFAIKRKKRIMFNLVFCSICVRSA